MQAPRSRGIAGASSQSSGCSDGCCHRLVHCDRATHLAVTRGWAVASARSSPLGQETFPSRLCTPRILSTRMVTAAAGALCRRLCQIDQPAAGTCTERNPHGIYKPCQGSVTSTDAEILAAGSRAKGTGAAALRRTTEESPALRRPCGARSRGVTDPGQQKWGAATILLCKALK